MKKNVKKLLALALVFVLAITLLPLSVESVEAASKKKKVIKIKTYEDFEKIDEDRDGSYKLMNDLVLEPGQKFSPVYIFTGVFDGNGHSIEVDITGNADEVGAFRYTYGATIKNLTVTGTVSGDEFVGGVVGHAEKSKIVNCINEARVSATGHCGGIAGRITDGKIYNCMNLGKLTVTDYALGGIVGSILEDGSVYNCANVGAVSGGRGYIGGIVGNASTEGNIKNCVNAANITSPEGSSGAILGHTKYKGSVANNYFYKSDTVNAHYKAYGKNSTSFNGSLKLKKAITFNGKKYTNVLDLLNAWAKAKSTSSTKYKTFRHENANIYLLFK